MLCPSCNNEMIKINKKNHNNKYNYQTLKCKHCAFVIFYNGISEFRTPEL